MTCFYIIIFLIGLLIGSFLNVCIYRIPRGESIIFPPSHCTNCKSRIKSYDLIPVLSFLLIKGRCRACGQKISIKYPIVEILTGLLYIIGFMKFGMTVEFLRNSILISILIAVAFIDLEHSIIPGRLMIFAAVAGIILHIIGYKSNSYLLSCLYGFLTGGGTIFLIVLLTGGMGGGDIQLMAVIGLFLGFKNILLTLMLSFIIGALAGITLVLLKKKSRRDYIPFGPFIACAALITIFYGDAILAWYISLL